METEPNDESPVSFKEKLVKARNKVKDFFVSFPIPETDKEKNEKVLKRASKFAEQTVEEARALKPLLEQREEELIKELEQVRQLKQRANGVLNLYSEKR